ncbi:hypothetical protein D9613_007898 [Agrocybe pediades]|uniref:Histone acetyltransferase n=1 Tax=Agrocybe pediades TaxID=84607 RepID=A0A8H4VKU4_9AGAR|nr:hypothetical protein D9613_007898 [Agrocybe pediades]
MRALAFPPNAAIDRELSYDELGTPISNTEEIPIDPALSETPIDPALMVEGIGSDHKLTEKLPVTKPENEEPPSQQLSSDEYLIRQYSEGPQGDPFAPQIPVPFFPVEPERPVQPPKLKRRRKVLREEECSFCQGNETKNKRGEPEAMLTCHECGRSGHPSCMGLEKLGGAVRSYPWKCIECKNCEVCQEKGDDERILFCDWCDRGWHMDCVEPPIQDPPEGEWHCPECPPVLPGNIPYPTPYQETKGIPPPASPSAVDREASVASTSRSIIPAQPTSSKPKRMRKSTAKGKARLAPKAAVATDQSDHDIPPPETPMVRRRGRPPKGSVRAKPRAPSASSEAERDDLAIRTPRRKRPRESSPPTLSTRMVRLRIPPQKGKGKEKEEEDSPHGLFDDFLSVEDRDTSKTTPTNADKSLFERSRITAEEKLAPSMPAPSTASSSKLIDNDFSTPNYSRPLRSAAIQNLSTPKVLDFTNSPGPSTPGAGTPLPKFEPGVLRIQYIRFGPYDIKTWYDAPFPEEYASIPDGRLWICEFCLKYMKSRFKAIRHQLKCKTRHPPGDEIYRDGDISIFEVDGRRNKIYCQNLCLLSKMFLDHKSLFYDVEPFLFYVITQVDDFGARFVGYFSKEKRCPKDYNLSCIMTLPVRQRQGWGNLLIDFSYLLSKIEQRVGSPEKPLSSLGALGYRNYWTLAVMRFLEKAPDNVRLEDISSATSMTIEDVCNTLIQQNMIFIESTPPVIRPSPGQTIKFPKGRKNGVARKHLQRMQTQEKDADGNKAAFVPPKHYEIHFDRQKVDAYLRTWESKGYLRLKPEKLQWTPYLVTRTAQEATVSVDLPAQDNVPLSTLPKVEPAVVETPTEPVTPAALRTMAVDSPMQVEKADEDEMPMVVDEVPAQRKTRTRSSARSQTKSPMKEEMSRPLRSNHDTSVPAPSSPPTPALRSLRTRSSHLNVPSPSVPIVTPSASTRSTRRVSRKSGRNGVENEENVGLKSPLEELTPGRTLRSGRTEVATEKKKPPVIPRAPSIRKRRRIESSPEIEASPTPEQLVQGAKMAETGQAVTDDAQSSMVVDDDAPAVKANGHHDGHSENQPLEIETPETSTLVDRSTTSAVEEEAALPGVMFRRETEIKAEDQGTPLTSLTSRHSLPSDDTVFINDLGTKSYGEYQGAVHAESDIRSTLLTEKPGIIYVDMEDCHDEDADGEYEEEDAEGEADSEVL